MIRQLRRLTRPVPGLRPGALAVAVYAEARDGDLHMRAAAEQGYEGVACLDDAARAALLYATIWRRHHALWARAAADGLLRFVCAMQEEDGAFANFILDWNGRRNLLGPTSRPGNGPWTARAMHALAAGLAAFGDAEYAERFERGLSCLDQPTPYLDVRAVAVLAALDHWSVTGAAHVQARAQTWADEIMAARIGDVLADRAGDAAIHLWGHLQEAALACAGRAFDRPDLVRAARRSTDALLAPVVAHAFAARRTVPFDVSSVIAGLNAVAVASGEPGYARLAAEARAWFHGRNTAGLPVYDQRLGRVYDGIDDGRVSVNSGAESNIEGALALMDSLPWHRFDRREGRRSTVDQRADDRR